MGMKKNGKRLLICTPSLATGGEFKAGKFPSGVPLIFEVEVVRVRKISTGAVCICHFVWMCVYVCMYVYMRACTFIGAFIQVCFYRCVLVCIYLFMWCLK